MSDAENKTAAEAPKTEEPKTVTEQATDAATATASAAASTASAVKDNVFSMFGGGPKKEKAEEKDEGADEPSGSSKATAAKTGDDVRHCTCVCPQHTCADITTAGGGSRRQGARRPL